MVCGGGMDICYLFISEFVMFRKIMDGTGKKKGFFDIVFFSAFLT